jgi:hypothetical protein
MQATSERERAKKNGDWHRPPVEVGMTVQWKHGPDATDDWAAALVTEVGDRTISVLVFPPGSPVGICRDGIHHADDPDLRRPGRAEEGCWRLVPLAGSLLKIMADLTGVANTDQQ